ncbi:hypothetical protein F869_04552 [Klebsiella pneumoniae subsp. pneumoniae CIP 52.145 = B5055]|nr:hypothetical protein F869_04552 [Klebsiella pneumoniae subsp. pneumoniae CIP 52.145 = B5055]
MMAGFMIHFWIFSLIAGWYKPQFKKEYHSTMRMSVITFLHAMTIVWFYHNRTD